MMEWKPFLLLDIQNSQKILRKQAPIVDFNMEDIGMRSIDILLAMSTHDMLIIPADIMKQFILVIFSPNKNGKCCSDVDR